MLGQIMLDDKIVSTLIVTGLIRLLHTGHVLIMELNDRFASVFCHFIGIETLPQCVNSHKY